MKVLNIKLYLKKNLEIILLSLIPATLFFKENINSWFIIIYFLFWAKNFFYKKIQKKDILKLKYYIIIIGIYLGIILIGNLYSTNYSKATIYLLRQTLILAFLFLTIHIKKDANKELISYIFILATFFFVVYIWGIVLYRIIEVNSLYVTDNEHPTWKYYLFTSGRLSPNVHPTYLSIYLVYAIFYLTTTFKKKIILNSKIIYYLVLLFFGVTLILLSSRGALFSFFLVIILFETYQILFKRKIKSLLKLVLFFAIITFMFSNASVMSRVSKLNNLFDKTFLEIAHIDNSIGKRTQIYFVGSRIVKDYFWLGIGSKNWEEKSRQYYKTNFKKDFDYYIEGLNTHNQYLNSFISWGFTGFLILVVVLFTLIYYSKKTEDVGILLFWCFFALVLITENILDRHRGIIFFSFFSALTVESYLRKGKKLFFD